ncbi:hypothetical protein AGRA3207_000187 [Actinomadura graeca]|uniref:Uncharacterized protein n=1 Tax=Actinomadura graeca TaxID=2750812 RepID=A0ABX8QLS5_9ACTN|nr:hypothetical protein [Actinomadura graeca]QXJ19625.1 hypothetical protein AGRA3207_000187 [Actinomadura graeca]
MQARRRTRPVAYCAPTYKGDPEGCFLRILEGGEVVHYSTRTVADTLGELDGKVTDDLRALGFEPTGDWFSAKGIHQVRLTRLEATPCLVCGDYAAFGEAAICAACIRETGPDAS